jgi:hypothetical protein
MNQILIVVLLALYPGMQQNTPSTENRFIGTWHGTSVCVDRKTDTACKDEEVVYVVKGIRAVRDTVEMEAFKIINGERLSMGMMRPAYSQVSGFWTFELAARVHALWAFQVKDSTVNGTLVELPLKRLIRQVHASRIKD